MQYIRRTTDGASLSLSLSLKRLRGEGLGGEGISFISEAKLESSKGLI